MDDVAFSETVAKYRAIIADRTAEKEAAAARTQAVEDKRAGRIQRLSTLGLRYDGDRGYIYDEFLVASVALIEPDDAFERTFAAASERIDAIKTAKAEAKAETERQAAIDRDNARIAQEQLDEINRKKALEAEAERQAALAPDKDKLEAYFAANHDVVANQPTLESEAAKALIERFFVEVSEVTNRYAKEAGRL
jgi:hypothetical protein